jgi:hypothetical protein
VCAICSEFGLADEPLTAVEPLVVDVLAAVVSMLVVVVVLVPFTVVVVVDASAFTMTSLEMENTSNEKITIAGKTKYVLFIFIKPISFDVYLN